MWKHVTKIIQFCHCVGDSGIKYVKKVCLGLQSHEWWYLHNWLHWKTSLATTPTKAYQDFTCSTHVDIFYLSMSNPKWNVQWYITSFTTIQGIYYLINNWNIAFIIQGQSICQSTKHSTSSPRCKHPQRPLHFKSSTKCLITSRPDRMLYPIPRQQFQTRWRQQIFPFC